MYYNLHIFRPKKTPPLQRTEHTVIYFIRHLRNSAERNPHKYTLVINVNHINDMRLMYRKNKYIILYRYKYKYFNNNVLNYKKNMCFYYETNGV